MRSKIVITCFSYGNNRKYMFNPDYLRSDLRRILSFVLNKIDCSLNDITVLTDLMPYGRIIDEVRTDFQDEVESYLYDIGYRGPIIRTGRGGIPLLEWLKRTCGEVSHSLHRNKDKLIHEITRNVLPIIRSSNAIEVASLFTNFVIVNGKYHYERIIQDIFSQVKHEDCLFFYYTGHGVRFISAQSFTQKVQDICLVIPSHGSAVEFLSRERLRLTFRSLPNSVSSFVVFDCCHSEKILNLPHKITFDDQGRAIIKSDSTISWSGPNMIYLASTQNDQTCGFYINREECGSVFTYHLINCLNTLTKCQSKGFSFLYASVEEKVKEYRKLSNKPPQNMLIGLSFLDIQTFPSWLSRNRLRLIEETT